jgi:hypothetical protein
VSGSPLMPGVIRLSFTMDNLDQLTAIGFVECGEWLISEDQLVPNILKFANARNVLYAFVVDNAVMYIGKTVQNFRSRMQGYRTPGATQFTNIRNHQNLRNALDTGKRVSIYVLPDNGLLHYGGFHVNLAAGLEDALVRKLQPSWNGGKKDNGEPPLSEDAV